MKRTLALSLTLLAALSACDKADKEAPATEAPKQETPTKQAPAPATEVKPATQTAANPGASLADAAGTFAIDSDHTQIIFKVKHLSTSFQYGQFTRVEGSLSIDPANLAASKVNLTIPTASVFTGNKKRDDHLRSPDLFDAKQFPTVTFKSTDVKATGANLYAVTGDLSMHGVTKPVTISLENVGAAADPEMMGGKFRIGFNGEVTINRADFGMTYMQGAGLGDDVKLLLAIEALRE
tara:strand:+ start:20039 stop:20749 length:711 start_codon:yes stop_codon:yes gene_type:complete